jgi:hypothetical protein
LLKVKKEAGFSFLPPRQCSSSHCCFNDGNSTKLKWDVLPHPAYSPDLAPSNYHLFEPMKGFLGGMRFQNNGEVMAGVQRWIQESLKPFLKLKLRSFQKVDTSALQSTGTTLKSSM